MQDKGRSGHNYVVTEAKSTEPQTTKKNVTVTSNGFGGTREYTVPVEVPAGRRIESATSDNVGGAHIVFDDGTSAYIRKNTSSGYNSATNSSQYTQTNSKDEYVVDRYNTPTGQAARVRKTTDAEKVDLVRGRTIDEMKHMYATERDNARDLIRRGQIIYEPAAFNAAQATLKDAISSINNCISSLSNIDTAITAASNKHRNEITDKYVKNRTNSKLENNSKCSTKVAAQKLRTAATKLQNIAKQISSYRNKPEHAAIEALAANGRIQTTEVSTDGSGAFTTRTVVGITNSELENGYSVIRSSSLSASPSSLARKPQYSTSYQAKATAVMAFTAIENGAGNAFETIADVGAVVGTAIITPFAGLADVTDSALGNNNSSYTKNLWHNTIQFVSATPVNDHFESLCTTGDRAYYNRGATEVMQYGNIGYNITRDIAEDATFAAIGYGVSKIIPKKAPVPTSFEATDHAATWEITQANKAVSAAQKTSSLEGNLITNLVSNKVSSIKANPVKSLEKGFNTVDKFNEKLEVYNNSIGGDNMSDLTTRALTSMIIANVLPDYGKTAVDKAFGKPARQVVSAIQEDLDNPIADFAAAEINKRGIVPTVKEAAKQLDKATNIPLNEQAVAEEVLGLKDEDKTVDFMDLGGTAEDLRDAGIDSMSLDSSEPIIDPSVATSLPTSELTSEIIDTVNSKIDNGASMGTTLSA